MPSSNDTIFQLTALEIVEASLRKLGVLAESQGSNIDQQQKGQQALNTVIGFLQTKNLQSWTRNIIFVPLVANTALYRIGIGQTTNTRYPKLIEQLLVENVISKSTIDLTEKHPKDLESLPSNAIGLPINYSYTKFINYGDIKVWPVPDLSIATQNRLELVTFTSLEYVTSLTETLHFPQEWQAALIYQLAVSLADEYQVSSQKQTELKAKADLYTKAADDHNQENSSIFFYPVKN